MTWETRISVPVGQMANLTEALTRAGVTVLDTGERVTTEEDVAAEAVLCVADLTTAPGEVSIHEPPMSE